MEFIYKDIKGMKDKDGDYDIYKNIPFTKLISQSTGIVIHLEGHLEKIDGKLIFEKLKSHEKKHRRLFEGFTKKMIEFDFI